MKNRAFTALNLDQYSQHNIIKDCGFIDVETPKEQNVLRMLIKKTFGEMLIPEELLWAKPIVDAACISQKEMGIRQPFVYITTRSGMVADDSWHVDGFSLNITHLPEQNYIWSNSCPTEYIEHKVIIPTDFDPFKHNIQLFFHDWISRNAVKVKAAKPKHLIGIDPYIIHRRPPIIFGKERMFVRVSFTPIEIEDINNTINPLINTNYTRDGVKEFRDHLERYNFGRSLGQEHRVYET